MPSVTRRSPGVARRATAPDRLVEATEQLLEARNKGDAAAVASAQAALDAVRRERAALP